MSRISDILDANAYKSDCGKCHKPIWCFPPRYPGAPSAEFPQPPPERLHYNASGTRHEHKDRITNP